MGYMNNDGLLYFWTKLKTIFVRTVNGNGPDANGDVSVAVPSASSTSPKMDGTATVGSETAYARGDHIHPTDTSRAASSHTHGNITNAGALQTTDITIANGDKLVVTDASNSSKVARTSVSFDGSTETKALTPKGTWANIPQAATTTPSMDGTAAVGSSAKYAKEDHVHPTDTTRAAGNGRIFYGTCSTAAATAGKEVVCLEFTADDLVAGTVLIVKFTNKNTANSVTFSITNGLGGIVASQGKSVKAIRAGVITDAGKLYTWDNGPYAFVYDGSANWIMQAETTTAYESSPAMNGTANKGSSNNYARGDHVHPTDTSRAPLASPALTGTPTAPTATAGTNTTQIATTAFVQSAIASAVSGVASFKGALNASSELEAIITVVAGWYWVVQTAGTYLGQDCEVGDFIYAVLSGSKLDASTPWSASFFAIIQTNITAMTNSEIDAIVAS